MHKKVIDFISVIRNSFPDSHIVYQFGGCYGFYTILKHIFPKSKAFITTDNNHIVTEINGKYYDIMGEYIDEECKLRHDIRVLTEKEHKYWYNVAYGQRLECMINKYNEHIKIN